MTASTTACLTGIAVIRHSGRLWGLTGMTCPRSRSPAIRRRDRSVARVFLFWRLASSQGGGLEHSALSLTCPPHCCFARCPCLDKSSWVLAQRPQMPPHAHVPSGTVCSHLGHLGHLDLSLSTPRGSSGHFCRANRGRTSWRGIWGKPFSSAYCTNTLFFKTPTPHRCPLSLRPLPWPLPRMWHIALGVNSVS